MIVEKKNFIYESNAVSVYSSRLYCWGVSLESLLFCGGVGSLCNGIYKFYCDIAPLQVVLCGLVPFLWRRFRCNIAATTFSFAAWYVLWVEMWLSLCCFDLAPLILKLCCSKPHNSSKCVISFQLYGRFCGEVLDEKYSAYNINFCSIVYLLLWNVAYFWLF